MKILILGAGQVGRTAAWHLAREPANEVTVVDTDEAVLRELQDHIDIRAVAGNASHPSVLESAGIGDTDILIALTSSDEVNIVACRVAHALYRTQKRIARIRSADFIRHPELFTEGAFAIDVTISPEQLVTEHINHLLAYPGAQQVVDFAGGRVQMLCVRARAEGLLVGKPLRVLRQHLPGSDARIAALYRNDRLLATLDGETVIEEHDEIYIVAARDDLRKVLIELRRYEPPVRRVVIAGAGNIGLRLARSLEGNGQVKLIERDARRARFASEVLRNAIVLRGDAADEELLIEENIDAADVFAALTNSEEANVMSAMLARRLGARRTMALVNRPAYGELIEGRNIDVVVSPQNITIGSLLTHVRRGDIARVHSLRRGAAEALEAVVHGTSGNSRLVGRRVQDIELPPGASVVTLVRGEQVVMAHRDTLIEAEDHVIVFLSDRRHVETLERLFQVEG